MSLEWDIGRCSCIKDGLPSECHTGVTPQRNAGVAHKQMYYLHKP